MTPDKTEARQKWVDVLCCSRSQSVIKRLVERSESFDEITEQDSSEFECDEPWEIRSKSHNVSCKDVIRTLPRSNSIQSLSCPLDCDQISARLLDDIAEPPISLGVGQSKDLLRYMYDPETAKQIDEHERTGLPVFLTKPILSSGDDSFCKNNRTKKGYHFTVNTSLAQDLATNLACLSRSMSGIR